MFGLLMTKAFSKKKWKRKKKRIQVRSGSVVNVNVSNYDSGSEHTIRLVVTHMSNHWANQGSILGNG